MRLAFPLIVVLGLVLPAMTSFSAAQAAPSANAEYRTIVLSVKNMTCNLCPITVRKALEKVPGVVKATVNFDTKTATVTFDPAKTGVDALTKATTEAGYPSTPKP